MLDAAPISRTQYENFGNRRLASNVFVCIIHLKLRKKISDQISRYARSNVAQSIWITSSFLSNAKHLYSILLISQKIKVLFSVSSYRKIKFQRFYKIQIYYLKFLWKIDVTMIFPKMYSPKKSDNSS